jgi:hypothetical protein
VPLRELLDRVEVRLLDVGQRLHAASASSSS